MSKGILCFAINNESINYVKQAKFLALRAKEYLDLPVSVVTNIDVEDDSMFDQVIKITHNAEQNIRRYYNGAEDYEVLDFRNDSRPLAYDLSPYDETIVLDTDYVICSDNLLMPFSQPHDFMLYDRSIDLAPWRSNQEFRHLSDTSVKFYWATCVFFRKTEENKIFFDLLKHIQQEWNYYNLLYEIKHPMYRNDYAFSIAIHIMNGFQDGTWARTFPRPIYFCTDKDFIYRIKDSEVVLFTVKHTEFNQYTLTKTIGTDVHIMNKYSLEEYIDE